MRAEIDLAEAGRFGPTAAPPVVVPSKPRSRLDWFELAVLAAFSGVSLWVLGLDLWQVTVHGRVWTGTDGFYLVDQMQYLAWIREASHHVLASNLFVLRDTPADYFQPAVVVSGGLSALGVAPWLSLLLWKPVAVGAAFCTARGYARRSLTALWPRRVALLLGLFFGSFTVVYGSVGVVGDLIPDFLSWGYTFGLIALAAMVGALLAYDRARAAARLAWAPGLLGALASSLHPWQGEVLILILFGAELMVWRTRARPPRRALLPVVTALATALPLVYYWILGRADPSWQLAREASKHSFSLLTIMLALAPLAVPAGFAFRQRPATFIGIVTRAWPVAALVIYVLSATAISATPLHAFEGVTIPLAVLAVEGAPRLGLARHPRRRLFAVLAVAAATVPATAYELTSARSLAAPSIGNANFITGDERQALRYLARAPVAGGVLTRFYLGSVVPAETGRRTFVGDCLWSQPMCTRRAKFAQQLTEDGGLVSSGIAQKLLEAPLTPRTARAYVVASGARFVLADCGVTGDLRRVLGPLIVAVHPFGCAIVYELDAPGRPVGPLAESAGHAALRAPGRQQRHGQRS